MNVVMNDEAIILDEDISVKRLLELYNFPYCAVLVNNVLIPKQEYDTKIISEKDIIDLIVPMQGG